MGEAEATAFAENGDWAWVDPLIAEFLPPSTADLPERATSAPVP
jgi:hypothetical protein